MSFRWTRAGAKRAAVAEVGRLHKQVETWMEAHGAAIKRSNRHVAARDVAEAEVEQLRAQLNEATSVPTVARRCSTCGEPMDTPGCCTSPESKDAYPHGSHTVYGGVGQEDI